MVSKKDIYYPEAERLYIQEQNTLNEISSRLRISEKTIRNWKAEGGWDDKKQEYLRSKKSFHEDLYEFSRDLMKGIKDDWGQGEKVDAGRLYTLTRILPLITKIKDYEDIKQTKDTAPRGLTEDIVKSIEKEVLGIE